MHDTDHHLKPGIDLEQLDAIDYATSDNETARPRNQTRAELFHSINHHTQNLSA
ncbi:hypothetical protein [Thioalkalivibrio sp. ALE11]|uniref:hypothetical protein n=1 Tax=Thioalkalivibrio sp. ALE11 TaxID=1265494 RepID=UPI00035ED79F|nr:hypothetical protein [Thioalkalivibrio sp. ALE11]